LEGTAEEGAVRLDVFDPAMCCSTGVCGPDVDTVLVQFASDLEWLKARGVTVQRYNLSQQPGAFIGTAVVRRRLQEDGPACLPLGMIDGRIVFHGRYPDRGELARLSGVVAGVS
jgi:hypothetical protein